MSCEIDLSIALQHDPSSDVIFLGVHSESIFPFMQYFFAQESFVSFGFLVAESINLDTSGKSTEGCIVKITSHSRIILSISLDELNSID